MLISRPTGKQVLHCLCLCAYVCLCELCFQSSWFRSVYVRGQNYLTSNHRPIWIIHENQRRKTCSKLLYSRTKQCVLSVLKQMMTLTLKIQIDWEANVYPPITCHCQFIHRSKILLFINVTLSSNIIFYLLQCYVAAPRPDYLCKCVPYEPPYVYCLSRFNMGTHWWGKQILLLLAK